MTSSHNGSGSVVDNVAFLTELAHKAGGRFPTFDRIERLEGATYAHGKTDRAKQRDEEQRRRERQELPGEDPGPHPDDPGPQPDERQGKGNGYARGEPLPPTRKAPAAPLPYFRGEAYRQAPRRDMVVKGLLGSGELTVWYGPPKSGKSFLVTDLALAVAEAVDAWFGHKIKRKGFVLYLVMEGASGYPNRLEAWSKARDSRPIPDQFIWVPIRLNFLTDGTKENAAADVERIIVTVEQLKAETGLPCVLIVVDTVARAMTGADENSSQDMGLFLQQCAILQELQDRPHVLVVHHESAQGGRTRGSTALNGGGNGFVHVTKTKDGNQWETEDFKDDLSGDKHSFSLHQTVLGTDEDGDEIKSCVVADGGAAKPVTQVTSFTPNQRVTLDALEAALCDHGHEPPPARDIPHGVKAVTVKEWHEAADRYLPPDTEKKKRTQAIKRAIEWLVANRHVRHVDGWFWLPKDGHAGHAGHTGPSCDPCDRTG